MSGNKISEANKVTVKIEGELGGSDGSIHFYGRGAEIVMWTDDEWVEDPSVVYAVTNAVINSQNMDCDQFAAIINKIWNPLTLAWEYAKHSIKKDDVAVVPVIEIVDHETVEVQWGAKVIYNVLDEATDKRHEIHLIPGSYGVWIEMPSESDVTVKFDVFNKQVRLLRYPNQDAEEFDEVMNLFQIEGKNLPKDE